MTRPIGEIFKVTIRDPETEDTITLSYRKPFTRERFKYAVELYDPITKKVKDEDEADEVRIRWGEKLIEGVEIVSTQRQPISSDPGSPHYLPEWRTWIREKAPQLLEELSYKVFQGLFLGSGPGTPNKEDPPEKKS